MSDRLPIVVVGESLLDVVCLLFQRSQLLHRSCNISAGEVE